MQVQPYLFFNGRCNEALAFYRDALGAEVVMKMLFKDSPEPSACPTAIADNVMHASVRIGDSMLMVSDGAGGAPGEFKNFSLSLTPTNIGDADKLFNALADGGNVQMPLTKTFFSPRFGMVADRFGVSWMIYVPGGEPGTQK